MKKFKTFDVAISILLIISFCIYGLINTKYLLIGYFVVGGWQLISMVIHAFNQWFTHRNTARYVYQSIVLVLLCLAVTGLIVQQVLMPLLFILVFVSPFMAVYYSWLCYHELTVKMQRPLTALK